MYLVFDIGATKLRLARSEDGQVFDEPQVSPTPKSATELVALFKEKADILCAGEIPQALAGGLTRHHEEAKVELAKLFSCPVYLENDTALVGLGEAQAGAGRGVDLLAYLTISTGVGGVRLIGGEIDRAAYGFEPGHQIINFLPERRTLEDYISGQALETRLGQSPKMVNDPVIWADLAQKLAYGLYNTILHWSPTVVVLGGSMILGRPGIDLAAVRQNLEQIPAIFPTWPELRLATLGDFGGLHGALHFLQKKLRN